jgi:hypothetical protein
MAGARVRVNYPGRYEVILEDRGTIPIRMNTEFSASMETTSPDFGIMTGVSEPLVMDQL